MNVTKTDGAKWEQSRQDDVICKRQRKVAKKECRAWRRTHQSKFQDNSYKGNWVPIADAWITSEKDVELDVAVNREFKSDHIKQGQLGDCYFLTSLSLMATRPGLLDKLILTPHINNAGIYKIRFCHDGQWKVITVDDRVPFIKHR